MINTLTANKWLVLGFGIGVLLNFLSTCSCKKYSPKDVPNNDSAISSQGQKKKKKVPTDCKMVLVVRKDLKMTKREIVVHTVRACLGAYKRAMIRAPAILNCWLYTGTTKIALKVNSEAELVVVQKESERRNVIHYMVKDLDPSKNSALVLAIGPDSVEDIDSITGHLRLY